MVRDNARAVPQPVLERAAHDIALPAPRPPVLERAAHDIALPAPRPPVLERAAHDIPRPALEIPRPALEPAALEMAQPAPRPVHEPRAGWILSAVVAATAAWVVGWVAGVSWAWRAMTPRYLPRTHRRRVAGLPASFGPGE
jgi:hypothetical protein